MTDTINPNGLTDEQKRIIRLATEECYHDVRHIVGDSAPLLKALLRLAKESFIAGRDWHTGEYSKG